MAAVRVLEAGDETVLFRFLERRLESSLFFLSNIEAAGLEDRGEARQATYVAHFLEGEVTAVAAHSWNGLIMVQGDVGLEEAVRAAVGRSGRQVNGFIGLRDLVDRARRSLTLEDAPPTLDSPDTLFALDLQQLRVPAWLSDPQVELRAPTAAEVRDPLTAWRVDYAVEALGRSRGAAIEEESFEWMSHLRETRNAWVLTHADRLVSFTGFNAQARGVVQVGGVWTPPELRSRGYGRAAVAGSLLAARAEGARQSVLFTSEHNLPAQRAYVALGYQPIASWRLLFLR